MKKRRRTFPVLEGAERNLTFNSKGDIVAYCDNEDGNDKGDVLVTASELRQIARASRLYTEASAAFYPRDTRCGHDVIIHNDGSVSFGCKDVEPEVVAKFAKISAKIAARRRK